MKVRLTNLSNMTKEVKKIRSYSVYEVPPGKSCVIEVENEAGVDFYKHLAKLLGMKMEVNRKPDLKRKNQVASAAKETKDEDDKEIQFKKDEKTNVPEDNENENKEEEETVNEEDKSEIGSFTSVEELEAYINNKSIEGLREILMSVDINPHPVYKEKGLKKQILSSSGLFLKNV